MRAVLGGLPPGHGLGPMPAIGASLSDDDIAKVVDYVRNNFGNAAPATSKPSEVETLRKETTTVMAPVEAKDCAKVETPETKALLDDGEVEKLAHVNPAERPQAIDGALKKLGPLAEKSPDKAVADLTAAYCRVVLQEGRASVEERAQAIGDFAVLAYSEAHRPGGLTQ
jgi:DNA segregation ATPase FtsK/SpoIIIE-like protein